MTEALADQGLVRRNTAEAVSEALEDTRVVLVSGARQVGKSTLAGHVLTRRKGALILSLDNATVRAAAQTDPVGFVRQNPSGTLAIDEVQRVPELFTAIKEVTDETNRPGQFLLTGSANVFALPQVADSLAGRMEVVDLYPFSQGELRGVVDGFVDALVQGNPPAVTSQLTKDDYLELAVAGGYPEVQRRPRYDRRQAWFRNYIRTLVQRDLKELADLERLDEVQKILRALAAYTSNLLNIDALSRDTRIPRTTLERYVTHIENIFLIRRLPAWSTNRLSRVVSTPKVHMVDSGLAAHLLGQSAGALAAPEGSGGKVLESFVVMEIVRQIAWSRHKPTPHHLRTKDMEEVDIVLELPDGGVAGVEVKSASTVNSSDFKGLRLLAGRTDRRFRAGVVLYTGRETLPFGDRLWASPISALWSAAAR